MEKSDSLFGAGANAVALIWGRHVPDGSNMLGNLTVVRENPGNVRGKRIQFITIPEMHHNNVSE